MIYLHCAVEQRYSSQPQDQLRDEPVNLGATSCQHNCHTWACNVPPAVYGYPSAYGAVQVSHSLLGGMLTGK